MKSFYFLGVLGVAILSGCASGHYRMRQEQREKLANSSGMYCDWVNGDKHSDIEVELNLQMGKRCDSNKSFSITTYKNTSDQNGVMYCCSLAGVSGGGGGASSGSMGSSAPAAPAKASGPAAKKTSPSDTSNETEIKE